MVPPAVFDRIVKVCGLSEVLGPGIVRRALADVEADPEGASVDDWHRVLPELRKRLRAYMSEAEVAQRMRSIELVLEAAEGNVLTPNPDRSSDRPSITTPNPD